MDRYKNENLKNEHRLNAAQNMAKRFNYIKAKIDNTQ